MSAGKQRPTAYARRREHGGSLLEAVAALGAAGLLLGGAASEGKSCARALGEVRSMARALTVARNVLDRALAAPCGPESFATDACEQGLRCTVAAEVLGQRAGAGGNLWMVRLRAEIFAGDEGAGERRLVRLTTIGTRPEACG